MRNHLTNAQSLSIILRHASVAELVDAVDSKSTVGNNVGVRFSPEAPFILLRSTQHHPKPLRTGLVAGFLLSMIPDTSLVSPNVWGQNWGHGQFGRNHAPKGMPYDPQINVSD